LELIANLHPDIVLVTKAFNRLETVQSLETWEFLLTLAILIRRGIISSSKKLSDVLGAPEAGATLAGELKRRLANCNNELALYPEACPVRGVDPAAYFCRQAQPSSLTLSAWRAPHPSWMSAGLAPG